MTPLQLTTLALYVAAAAAAVALARRDRGHRPVAGYLVAIIALDLLRLGRAAVLAPATGPRQGWELLVRHGEQAAYLAAILALPAMAVALFGGRSVWPVVGAGAVLWAVVVAGYPELRGPELLALYRAVELSGLVLAAGCFITWLRSPRLLEQGPSPAVLSGLALVGGTGAAAMAPLVSWPAVVAANATALACVLAVQLRVLIGSSP